MCLIKLTGGYLYIMFKNQTQFLLHQIILIKKVDNNSDKWSFENFKKLKIIHQLQFQEMNFNKKNIINFKLDQLVMQFLFFW